MLLLVIEFHEVPRPHARTSTQHAHVIHRHPPLGDGRVCSSPRQSGETLMIITGGSSGGRKRGLVGIEGEGGPREIVTLFNRVPGAEGSSLKAFLVAPPASGAPLPLPPPLPPSEHPPRTICSIKLLFSATIHTTTNMIRIRPIFQHKSPQVALFGLVDFCCRSGPRRVRT